METPVECMETPWACNDNVFSLLTKTPHGVYVDSMKHMDSVETSPIDYVDYHRKSVDSPWTGYFNKVNRKFFGFFQDLNS
jgi:hypothetical protein